MAKYIDAKEITPIMAEYVADVFSRKEHLDNISYGYCMEIADVFRRYAERAKQEQQEKSKKDCNDCPHCVDRKDQYGWHFKGCFGGPYKGKFIAEIDECPLRQEQPDVDSDLEEAANEFANQDCVTFISRKKGFIAGAEWQKEQDDKMVDIIYQQGIEKGKDEMRKKAIEGILFYCPPFTKPLISVSGINPGVFSKNAEVKLIILKNDE